MAKLSLSSVIKDLDNKRINLKTKRARRLPFFISFPILAFGISASIFFLTVPTLIATMISVFISVAFYNLTIGSDFKKLKTKVKKTVIDECMKTYHEDIHFKYYPYKRSIEPILNKSKLIKADRYQEEDVIVGESKETKFYISEIKLLDEDEENQTTTKFKGLLFKIKNTKKNYARSAIYSAPSFLNSFFTNYKKVNGYNFVHYTSSEKRFQQEIKPLFPFIQHLINKNNDVRIFFDGDEITILMESDIKFLDEPKMEISKSFENEAYYRSVSKQINSLLYIVESFSSNLNQENLEDHLELKAQEALQISNENDQS